MSYDCKLAFGGSLLKIHPEFFSNISTTPYTQRQPQTNTGIKGFLGSSWLLGHKRKVNELLDLREFLSWLLWWMTSVHKSFIGLWKCLNLYEKFHKSNSTLYIPNLLTYKCVYINKISKTSNNINSNEQ